VCSREAHNERACPTKLLWARVRGSIVTTLRETTLADLALAPGVPSGTILPTLDIQPLTTGA